MSPTSTWTLQPSAPARRKRLEVVARVGDHQVAVEVEVGVAAEGRHHRRPDASGWARSGRPSRRRGAVGLAGAPRSIGVAEGGEVSGEDGRGDASHVANLPVGATR